MNPSTPHLNHLPFPYPSQNPNPNHNYLLHAPPPPKPPQVPPPITTILDLPTTLSTLTNLLSHTNQTLSSLSPQITLSKPQNANFIPCPFNRHHLMPPESLFLHSLNCPVPLFQHPSSPFDYLHYPNTLNPQDPHKDSNFTQSIQDPNETELCFSLDSYYNQFSSHFSYNDCPGAVNLNDLDSSKRMFALPGVLLIECVNFGVSGEREQEGFDKNGFRVLPSDLWAIRREIEGWIDYPSVYSYSVFCLILRLDLIKRSDLRRWIIANSPRYGVVIDVYMRDHICVIFRLCLKAIRREALSSVSSEMNVKSLKCPILVQVLMWMASQLSILYGEVNAKCFAIHVLKLCLLEAANEVVVFLLDSCLKESLKDLDAYENEIKDSKLGETPEGSRECKIIKAVDEGDDRVIFVTQVAAAVAALHERSILEAKIKLLRVPQQLPRYQRMAELSFVSKRADDERSKRPNYKAIIEHDGLPRKHLSNQESNKTKTKEELLAEERDYKRRRMSYRGKKLKRTTLQVMRDIIDGYMEEIKLAGGIGRFEKGTEEEEMSSKPPSAPEVTVNELRKVNSHSSELNHYQKESYPDHNSRSKTSKDLLRQYYEQQGRSNHGYHEKLEYQRSAKQDRHGREYSRSPERYRSLSRSHERSSHQRGRDDAKLTRSKDHEKRLSSKSYVDYKSLSSGLESADGMQRDYQKLNTYGNHGSNSVAQNAFDDRYDPTESHDMHEDDVYTGITYAREEVHD
uniref:CHHC U11-48K-type domain-containing protein n=1 Tax=Salix viminalis TaxID=40686 RepID=A0A6N2KIK9_SALVM